MAAPAPLTRSTNPPQHSVAAGANVNEKTTTAGIAAAALGSGSASAALKETDLKLRMEAPSPMQKELDAVCIPPLRKAVTEQQLKEFEAHCKQVVAHSRRVKSHFDTTQGEVVHCLEYFKAESSQGLKGCLLELNHQRGLQYDEFIARYPELFTVSIYYQGVVDKQPAYLACLELCQNKVLVLGQEFSPIYARLMNSCKDLTYRMKHAVKAYSSSIDQLYKQVTQDQGMDPINFLEAIDGIVAKLQERIKEIEKVDKNEETQKEKRALLEQAVAAQQKAKGIVFNRNMSFSSTAEMHKNAVQAQAALKPPGLLELRRQFAIVAEIETKIKSQPQERADKINALVDPLLKSAGDATNKIFLEFTEVRTRLGILSIHGDEVRKFLNLLKGRKNELKTSAYNVKGELEENFLMYNDFNRVQRLVEKLAEYNDLQIDELNEELKKLQCLAEAAEKENATPQMTAGATAACKRPSEHRTSLSLKARVSGVAKPHLKVDTSRVEGETGAIIPYTDSDEEFELNLAQLKDNCIDIRTSFAQLEADHENLTKQTTILERRGSDHRLASNLHLKALLSKKKILDDTFAALRELHDEALLIQKTINEKNLQIDKTEARLLLSGCVPRVQKILVSLQATSAVIEKHMKEMAEECQRFESENVQLLQTIQKEELELDQPQHAIEEQRECLLEIQQGLDTNFNEMCNLVSIAALLEADHLQKQSTEKLEAMKKLQADLASLIANPSVKTKVEMEKQLGHLKLKVPELKSIKEQMLKAISSLKQELNKIVVAHEEKLAKHEAELEKCKEGVKQNLQVFSQIKNDTPEFEILRSKVHQKADALIDSIRERSFHFQMLKNGFASIKSKLQNEENLSQMLDTDVFVGMSKEVKKSKFMTDSIAALTKESSEIAALLEHAQKFNSVEKTAKASGV
jgi:hypothetical protein